MIKQEDFPELVQFLGCTFHQDWVDEAGSPQERVDMEISHYSRQSRERIVGEINALVAPRQTDADIEAWFKDVGCYVRVEARGLTARTFCAMVGERLSASLATG